MLLTISNTPRDYAWGSTTAIARLEGREPTGTPEAEVWFGDHPGAPARLADGRTLPQWISSEGASAGVDRPLPFLLKLLAAGAPLSIQAHPSKSQAVEGFARENAAGIPVDAPARSYRDDNHKPEIVVAVSDTFTALSGFRPLERTRRLVAALGDAGAPLATRLSGDDEAAAIRDTVAWLLSSGSSPELAHLLSAVRTAASDEFAPEIDTLRRIAEHYPDDPGVLVALLLNRVELRRGDALYTDAGVPHAYLEGLGVELMAASDNVLRGGLTPKHVDVAELLSILDTTPRDAHILSPVASGDAEIFAPGIADFELARLRVAAGERAQFAPRGAAIALCTDGSPALVQGGDRERLAPGAACLVTPVGGSLTVDGPGEVYIAQSGRDTP